MYYIRDCEWCGIRKLWRHRFRLFCMVCAHIPMLVADGIETPAAGSMRGCTERESLRAARAGL